MNENSQPRLPEVDRFIRKTKFLKFMRVLDTFDYVYSEAEPDNLRQKLESLETGKPLLNHDQEFAFHDSLVVKYRDFLRNSLETRRDSGKRLTRDQRLELAGFSRDDSDRYVEETASFLRHELEPTAS